MSPDCLDGSDENSTECDQGSIVQNQCDNESFFHCKYSRKCVPKQWLCDEVYDCGLIVKFSLLDTSDEDSSQNCTKKCPVNKLPCSNGVCLHISKFCDGHIDCPNDEFSCADRSPCKNLKCDYDCKVTPHGPQCFCPAGQDIVNATKCVVQKECVDDVLDDGEVCDQQCINIKGKNKCSCAPGYERVNSRCLGVNGKSCLLTFHADAQRIAFHSPSLGSHASVRSHFEENLQNSSAQRTQRNGRPVSGYAHPSAETKRAHQHGDKLSQSHRLRVGELRDLLLQRVGFSSQVEVATSRLLANFRE